MDNTNQEVKVLMQNLDIAKTKIIIPVGLHYAPIKNIDKITHKEITYISAFHPPILLNQDKAGYELSGRAWLYKLQVENDITQIRFLIFENRADIAYYITKIEQHDNASIESLIQSLVRQTSKATIARHRAINARRQCPFCGDALMSERGTPKPDKDGNYHIHCYHSKQDRCDFDTVITSPEQKDFQLYQLNTNDWICIIPDKKCPSCGNPLYLRIWHMPDGKKIYIEICRNYKLSKKISCGSKKQLKEKPIWYNE